MYGLFLILLFENSTIRGMAVTKIAARIRRTVFFWSFDPIMEFCVNFRFIRFDFAFCSLKA